MTLLHNYGAVSSPSLFELIQREEAKLKKVRLLEEKERHRQEEKLRKK